MKAGIYIALALLGGAVLAQLLLADPGYVAIRFAGRLIEMSAITFIIGMLALYFLVRLVLKAVRARRLWREATVQRRQDRARRSLAQGLLQMSEGDWESSEDTLVRSAREAESPAAHYLVAARAADLQGAAERRDDYINRAIDASGTERAPALIMQAEMHLKHKQYQAALIALQQLETAGHSSARIVELLARIYRQTGDWQALQNLEPRLRSTRGISTHFADETVAQIYMDRLQAASTARDASALNAAWKELPKSLAQRPEIVVAYARGAMVCKEHALAEAELRRLLNRQWDEAAVLAYGDLDAPEPLAILERAEQWLPEHREDAALLYTCARLSIRAELYGKARSYLQTSVAIRPRLEAWHLLAVLLEQLGERDLANQALTNALAEAIGRKPQFPKIRARRWVERRQSDRRRY
jgi:HemY protein